MMASARRYYRRANTVPTLLRCDCGYAERWPLPFAAHVGRCTCSHCGGQLREDAANVSASVAWRQAA